MPLALAQGRAGHVLQVCPPAPLPKFMVMCVYSTRARCPLARTRAKGDREALTQCSPVVRAYRHTDPVRARRGFADRLVPARASVVSGRAQACRVLTQNPTCLGTQTERYALVKSNSGMQRQCTHGAGRGSLPGGAFVCALWQLPASSVARRRRPAARALAG